MYLIIIYSRKERIKKEKKKDKNITSYIFMGKKKRKTKNEKIRRQNQQILTEIKLKAYPREVFLGVLRG